METGNKQKHEQLIEDMDNVKARIQYLENQMKEENGNKEFQDEVEKEWNKVFNEIIRIRKEINDYKKNNK
jgi:uncharacterized protein YhaN